MVAGILVATAITLGGLFISYVGKSIKSGESEYPGKDLIRDTKKLIEEPAAQAAAVTAGLGTLAVVGIVAYFLLKRR